MFDRTESETKKKTICDDASVQKEFSQLEIKIDRLSQSVEIIHGENKKILKKLDEMFNAMYNPDEGLYARIKEQEGRISVLESFKGSTNKALWLISSTLIGGLVKIVLDFFTVV